MLVLHSPCPSFESDLAQFCPKQTGTCTGTYTRRQTQNVDSTTSSTRREKLRSVLPANGLGSYQNLMVWSTVGGGNSEKKGERRDGGGGGGGQKKAETLLVLCVTTFPSAGRCK